ncbi:MAG: HAAS signaling domain-containing protein, partial [Promethearchaeota archaeon]
MSTNNLYGGLIADYLERVKKKLPSWLREDPDELDDILEELEEHIWDKAQDLAGGPEATLNAMNVQEAIVGMGRPEDIAREYKKRGTPKVFISKEWWPWYTRVLTVVFSALVLINFITLAFSIGKSSFGTIMGSFIGGIWNSALYSGIIVSLVFIALSMQGFLPTDFKEMYNKYKKYVNVEEKPTKSIKFHQLSEESISTEYNSKNINNERRRAEREARRAERESRRSEREARRAERESRRSEREVKHVEFKIKKKIKDHKKKSPLNAGSCLSSGIWGILWGLLLILQPIESLNIYFTLDFLQFVQFIGVLTVSEAVVQLFQAFLGKDRVLSQRIMFVFLMI